MRERTRAARTIAGLALGAMLAAGAALAQTDEGATAPAAAAPAAADAAKTKMKAPRKAKAKPKMASVAVVVSNRRAVALVELQAAEAGGGETTKIAGPIAPGKKATAHVKHGKSCVFDLRGLYDDGSQTDVPGVDLCADKTINLVD